MCVGIVLVGIVLGGIVILRSIVLFKGRIKRSFCGEKISDEQTDHAIDLFTDGTVVWSSPRMIHVLKHVLKKVVEIFL